MHRSMGTAVILAAALAVPATAQTPDRPVVLKGREVRAVGKLALPAKTPPTLGQVRRALGRPSSTTTSLGDTGSNGSADSCTLHYRALGMSADFSYGGDEGNGGYRACAAEVPLDRLALRSSRYRLPSGLRPGDSLARLRKLHPRAERDDSSEDEVFSLYGGTNSDRDLVHANVKRGKVAEIVVDLPSL